MSKAFNSNSIIYKSLYFKFKMWEDNYRDFLKSFLNTF